MILQNTECLLSVFFVVVRIPESSQMSSRWVRQMLQQMSLNDSFTALTVCRLCANVTVHDCVFVSLSVTQAAVGKHPVQDVYLCPNTKKLVIRLADSCDRLQWKHIYAQKSWRHQFEWSKVQLKIIKRHVHMFRVNSFIYWTALSQICHHPIFYIPWVWTSR